MSSLNELKNLFENSRLNGGVSVNSTGSVFAGQAEQTDAQYLGKLDGFLEFDKQFFVLVVNSFKELTAAQPEEVAGQAQELADQKAAFDAEKAEFEKDKAELAAAKEQLVGLQETILRLTAEVEAYKAAHPETVIGEATVEAPAGNEQLNSDSPSQEAEPSQPSESTPAESSPSETPTQESPADNGGNEGATDVATEATTEAPAQE